MHLYIHILLLNFIALLECSDFEKFYEYVNNHIKYSEDYLPPKNNEKLLETCDSSLQDYGEYDFIIVGGGSAGSVLASRLSEITDWKVLLLEAGGNQNNFSDIPALSGYVTHSPMDWGYYTKPQNTACQGMVNKQCSYPRGKVLGGSGVLNVMVYSRATHSDYDTWSNLGNEGWSYEEVLPYFIKSERIQIANYDRGYHGTQGPLHINYTAPPSILSESVLEACKEKGLDQVDYNGRSSLGVSRVQFTINFNKRDNGAHAFLDPIMNNRPNLEVLLNSFVVKILLNNTVANGVEFIRNGKRYVARAKKEVILSGGSINSAQLLMISGIGPADELAKHRIKLQNDLPVGKTMKDHPLFLNLVFRTNKAAANRTMRENLKRYIIGKTPLTNALGVEHIAFINTKMPGKGLPDIELAITPPPLGVPPNAKLFFNVDDNFNKVFQSYDPLTDFCIYIVLLKPKSNGSVTLQSKSPRDFPVIDLNYFSDPNKEDIETMYQGIKYALSLLETKAFKAINVTYIGNQLGCEELRKNGSDREYWYCAIRDLTSTIFHPVSTTPMGRSPRNSVVNNHCLVHKMKNLRVVDAGVMPEIIRGHPNAPVFMISEKTSDDIKIYHGKL